MKRLTVLLVVLALALVAAPAAPALETTPLSAKTADLAPDDCEEGRQVPVAALTAQESPVGITPCPGVRPGALVRIPRANGTASCTLNFVYRGRDANDRTTMYIGTAGHCILPDSGGERSWAPGRGPAAHDAQGNRIGEFAYAVLGNSRDFALIRLASGVRYDPQMCHFGGPRGVNNEQPGTTTVTLRHYGRGLGTGLVLPARTSVARGMPDPDRIFAMGVVAPGDSGSPVLAPDGRGVGVVVTVGAHLGGTVGQPQAGTVGMTRVGPQLARAGQVLGQTMRIVQAPLL